MHLSRLRCNTFSLFFIWEERGGEGVRENLAKFSGISFANNLSIYELVKVRSLSFSLMRRSAPKKKKGFSFLSFFFFFSLVYRRAFEEMAAGW